MFSRRSFGACALCAVAGFAASAVEVGTVQAAGGFKRTVLHKIDFPDKYATILVLVEAEAGATIARHTHPGVESAYVVEGSVDLSVAGEPEKTYRPGEGFQIPPMTAHGGRFGDKPSKVAVTYVVERDKPLSSPAPE